MIDYFTLLYKLTNRRFKDNGIQPIFAYIVLTCLFFGFSIYLFYRTDYAVIIYSATALFLVLKLSEHRRTEFLKLTYSPKIFRRIRSIENVIFSLPFLLVLVMQFQFIATVLLFVTALLLSFIELKPKNQFTLPTPFHKHPFEFIIGFRKTYALILLSYILGGIAVYVENVNLGIFSVVSLFLIAMGYYSKLENAFYIWSFHRTSSHFLFEKIKTGLGCITVLLLPGLLIQLIGFPQHFILLALALLTGYAFLIAMITAKYASYPEEIGIFHAFMFAFSVTFPPILLVIIPILFIQAKQKLTPLMK